MSWLWLHYRVMAGLWVQVLLTRYQFYPLAGLALVGYLLALHALGARWLGGR
jgi:hypothetical protein